MAGISVEALSTGGTVRIVDRATFLAMPAGTVYAKYKRCVFDDLAIKEDSLVTAGHPASRGDWFYQQIADSIEAHSSSDLFDQLDHSQATGASIPMDFDSLGRDGLFERDQLFAVWEPQDVRALIKRLQRALADVESQP